MELMSDEEREALLTEYKTLHDENWRRGQNMWVVYSILITGSLIVAFQSRIENFPCPLVSLALIVMALIMHATTEQVTRITYERMGEIGEMLGIIGPKKMYESQIKGKWWYRIRRNEAYALFTILISVYSLLLFNRVFLSIAVLVTGFLLIIAVEIYCHLRREVRESIEKEMMKALEKKKKKGLASYE